jgi:hypothetical protein
VDGSGLIDVSEIEIMLKEVYGRSYETNTHAAIIRKKIAAVCDGKGDSIGVDFFAEFVRKHPALLFPAFELQTKLQNGIVGRDFWSDASSTRVQMSNGEYVSINQILKTNIHEGAFEAMVMKQDEEVVGVMEMSGLVGERKYKMEANERQRQRQRNKSKSSSGRHDRDRDRDRMVIEEFEHDDGREDDGFKDYNEWKTMKDAGDSHAVDIHHYSNHESSGRDNGVAHSDKRSKDVQKKWKKAGNTVKAANGFKRAERSERSERSERKSAGSKDGSRRERKSKEKVVGDVRKGSVMKA